MNTDFIVIIPARYASTRLSAKALRPIAGQPMIAHVYQRACESGAQAVYIATDDQRIAEAAHAFDAPVLMTDEQHISGTDRVAEAAQQLKLDDQQLIVNLQGDEPLMPPKLISEVAQSLTEHPDAHVATACHPMTDLESIFNPNQVKVVRDQQGYALYFSRAPIPWIRGQFDQTKPNIDASLIGQYQRHIGLYAYRYASLKQITAAPACALEQAEALEQLRVLYQGLRIHVVETEYAPEVGVDTKADLIRVQEIFKSSTVL